MDFTFMFLIILMLLAAKSGIYPLAGAMLILAFVAAKNRYSLFGALIAAVLLAAMYIGLVSTNDPVILIVGLFIIFLIAVKSDPAPPAYGGGYPGQPY